MTNTFDMTDKRVTELCDLHETIYKKNTDKEGMINHKAITEKIKSICVKLPEKERYFLWFVEGHIHCMLDAKLNENGVKNLLETADVFLSTINNKENKEKTVMPPMVMDYDVGGMTYLNK